MFTPLSITTRKTAQLPLLAATNTTPADGDQDAGADSSSAAAPLGSSLRSHVVGFLRRTPWLYRAARSTYLGLWRKQAALATRLTGRDDDAPLTLRLDPRRISLAGVGWDTRRDGDVAGGDWDLDVMPFEHLDVFQALVAHFRHQVSWQETSYYHSLAIGLERNATPWPIDGPDDLHHWLRHLELLYRVAAGDSTDATTNTLAFFECDEVTVRIGRDGAFLADRGRHWLAIAQIAGLPEIEVRVSARHRDWQRFRDQVLRYAAEHGGSVYQPITHPDLAQVPSGHGHERFEMLRAHLGATSGKLLDIGANWGYFCHRFEEQGFDCYAVERSLLEFGFLDRLRRAEGRRFTAINLDVFRFLERTEFDVVLALNIFHHFLKTESDYAQLIQLLRRLRARELFLETHDPSEPQMRGAYRNLEPLEFVRFVAEHGGFDRWEHLGAADETGRHLYRLVRGGGAEEIRESEAPYRYPVEAGPRPPQP